jgi:hypothetical protein
MISNVLTTISKNAATAKNGNRAEVILCSQPSVRTAFETKFAKPIQAISLIKGRKKSDVSVAFQDGSTILLQNKDGDGGGRGWSIDRRDAVKHTTHVPLHTLLKTVCLKDGTEKPTIPKTISDEILTTCLLGEDAAYTPQFFVHTKSNKSTGEITHLSICPTETFLSRLREELYPSIVPKKTCVHLSPALYLQRKGGGDKDHSPDQIQVKLRLHTALLGHFTTLPLV